MNAWFYLLIPFAIIVAIFLGIRYRNSSRRFMAPLVGGSLVPGDGAHYGGDHHSSGGHGGDSGGGGDG